MACCNEIKKIFMMIKQIDRGIMIILVFTVMCALGCASAKGKSKDPLLFPKEHYTIETKIVKTSAGEKKVTYQLYKHITYVAKPVDTKYQSMNVSVPIKVDGIDIDTTNVPILFDIDVGGYFSAIAGVGPQFPPGGPGGPPGGPPGAPPGGPPPGPPPNVNPDLALAAGYIVVSPGCRGHDNKATDGTYYGKAPAAIVDLKAAVRYVRHNDGAMPGNADWIITTGGSAGGALSALLGTSCNHPMYDEYLREIGAADVEEKIYASACYCPVTDLEYADMAYEWMYGTTPTMSGLVNQELSKQLKDDFAKYQASLNLKGKNGFGTITADNYTKYLIETYLIPSANIFLRDLPDEKRKEYLANNRWVTWTDKGATFTFTDYVAHVGRMKGLPAFDDFDMMQPETILFGDKTTNARHFTNFSLRQTTGDKRAEIGDDLKRVVNLMNPMYFIGQNSSICAKYWWIRHGTRDNHTSLAVITNLAISLENLNKNVNTLLYWDAEHGANEDPEDFISWINNITGYSR